MFSYTKFEDSVGMPFDQEYKSLKIENYRGKQSEKSRNENKCQNNQVFELDLEDISATAKQ